ncbi:S-formylglutathione hydrolase [Chloropicon primus]|uniref:S-formylglutathione hydrolase n=1 Tax=Chloropicon primus TaxID=1764295 RepID=A0A5B8MXF3_9CHLO|nr:S-formylglutathione hydrolase [Chloropicon primus]UPR04239.1 S-formylglutathione hydrolase [Chloropicon primus]|eukprot:QDZ25031.1 S-formylglutathione hydrolase [Chloropicon primus]
MVGSDGGQQMWGVGMAVAAVAASAVYAFLAKRKEEEPTTAKVPRKKSWRRDSEGKVEFTKLQVLYDRKCFGGRQIRYLHESKACKNKMVFSVYLPACYDEEDTTKVPFIYCLTGLTTSDEYFPTSTGIQQFASKHRIALVCPDTSPRNTGVEGESESFEVGIAAGLYCDATEKKWSKWQMYSYVVKELPKVLAHNFPKLDQQNCTLLGHSMGGCGSLQIYLKNSTKYKGCSCINAVTNPSNGVWGPKPLTAYLGDNPEAWKKYDPTEVVAKYSGQPLKIWIEQGSEDPYLNFDLLPYNFKEAADKNKRVDVKLTYRAGYDHGFACVTSLIEGHLYYHAKILGRVVEKKKSSFF